MSIRVYSLDGAELLTLDALHDQLAARFALAPYYGRNLDALWDLLTERREGGIILFRQAEQMPKELSLPLLGLFSDLTEANGRWQLKVLSPESEEVQPIAPAPLKE